MNTIWQLHCDKYNIYRQIQSGEDNVTNAIRHKQADKLNHTKKETNGIHVFFFYKKPLYKKVRLKNQQK